MSLPRRSARVSKENAISHHKPTLLHASGTCVSLVGLILICGLWLSAAIIALVDGDSRAGLTIGLASEQWLANLVIRGDGSVLVQHFEQNLTGLDGLYLKSARAVRRKPGSQVSFVPRTVSSAISGGLSAHMLLLLLPFLILTGYTVVLPLLRRWRRRRCLACLACGYSLRAAVSGTCPECGAPI